MAVFYLYSETDNTDGIFGKKKKSNPPCVYGKLLISVQIPIIERHINRYIFCFMNSISLAMWKEWIIYIPEAKNVVSGHE